MASSKAKIPVKLLALSLVLVLLGSFVACLFNTSLFTVNVSRISFDTANGQLSGLLYLPNGASQADPRPAVVATHGYLNSAEMQDLNAIELSRRGYVVLALDQYDHGHSNINEAAYGGNTDFISLWSPFWINSMYDAVQYIYEQPYVLKDEAGNGIIGVTGHSMGGFSSTIAVAKDEADFAATGVRKIYANLTEGSDFSYTAMAGVTAQAFDAAAGGRYLGKVAAQYDEFFFGAPEDPAGTVRQKNYVATPDGKTFLQQENGQPGTWYDTTDGGKRIIYQPHETHPWNHFSLGTCADVVSFYTTAFANFAEDTKAIDPANQIWIWKVAGELVALIGFVMFIIAMALTITALPGFSKSRTQLIPVQQSGGGILGAVIMIVALLLPAIFFENLYNWANLDAIFYGAIALTVVGGGYAFFMASKAENKKGLIVGGCFAVFAGGLLAVLTRMPILADAGFWTAPVINDIAKWTVGSLLISQLIMALVYIFLKSKNGVTLADYGVKLDLGAILSGLVSAVLTVFAGYVLLFAMDAIFKADFRIWTFAFKTFDANIAPAILRYLPIFLAYYMISSAAICINTNTKALQGVKGYLVAMALNAGGILIWLIRQYVTLFSTGVAAHPDAALSGIVLVAMVPTLAVAAIISRALYKRTGNIWTAAFTNGLLMTIMTLANTTVFFK